MPYTFDKRPEAQTSLYSPFQSIKLLNHQVILWQTVTAEVTQSCESYCAVKIQQLKVVPAHVLLCGPPILPMACLHADGRKRHGVKAKDEAF